MPLCTAARAAPSCLHARWPALLLTPTPSCTPKPPTPTPTHSHPRLTPSFQLSFPAVAAAPTQADLKAWAAANPACQQTLRLAEDLGWESAKEAGEAAPPAGRVQVGNVTPGTPGNSRPSDNCAGWMHFADALSMQALLEG